MCVIFLAEKERPTEEMVEKAYAQNSDGGGGAWREVDAKGKREVVWKKGLDLAGMIDLCATAPLPFVAHFRIASIGGIRPSLTHPFLVSKQAPLALEGRTRGHVLFHNGHWKEWAENCREAAIRSNTPIPTGKWSDTRAMAYLCSIYGLGFMEFLPDQKGILFGADNTEVFTGNGFTKINNVWCSNDYFMARSPIHHAGNQGNQSTSRGLMGRMCRFDKCTGKVLDVSGYCVHHPNGVQVGRKFDDLPPLRQHGVDHQALANNIGNNSGARGTQSVIPFRPLRAGEKLTLERAETLYKELQVNGERKISKNLLKRIRELFHSLNSQKERTRNKSLLALAKISIEITQPSSGLVN